MVQLLYYSTHTDISFFSAEGDAIKVYMRVRPPPEGTIVADGDHGGLCLSVLSSSTVRLHSKPEPKIFTFDHVADVDTTQVNFLDLSI